MKNGILDGQIDLFEVENKPNHTLEQSRKIEELKTSLKVEEVSISKAGVVTVIVKSKFKPIIPQGNTLNIIYPKWKHKTYFLDKSGEIIAVGVGATR